MTEIDKWINQVIKGSGGFIVWEDRECIVHSLDGRSREEGVAAFVLRCLANPHCEGSEEVLNAIYKQRQKVINKPAPHANEV